MTKGTSKCTIPPPPSRAQKPSSPRTRIIPRSSLSKPSQPTQSSTATNSPSPSRRRTTSPPPRLCKAAGYNFLEDLTCVDWYPSEPRFQVTYHLLSHTLKARVRVIVLLPGESPSISSLIPVWPSANFYEREVFDLFGVHFGGHPNLKRIMMPEDWQGNPLRKDYPVEGYR